MPAPYGIHIPRPVYISWKWSDGESQDMSQEGTEICLALATCSRPWTGKALRTEERMHTCASMMYMIDMEMVAIIKDLRLISPKRRTRHSHSRAFQAINCRAVHRKNCLLYPYLLTFNPLPKTFFWHFWKRKLFLPYFHQKIMIFPLWSNERKKYDFLPTYPTKKYRVGVQPNKQFLRMA